MPDFSTPYLVPTDQATVLQAVVDRIQAQVPDLDADNRCFISMKPEPRTDVRQSIYCTVCPMSGDYDQEMFAGAGADGVVEHSGVIVTVFSQMKLDRSDADASMLLHADRGLLKLKGLILKALAGHSLANSSNEMILLQPMAPINSGYPRDASENAGEFSLSFSTDFRWDLS